MFASFYAVQLTRVLSLDSRRIRDIFWRLEEKKKI